MAEAVTRSLELGPSPDPERLQGTLEGLLSVAAVVYLKMRGAPVTREAVPATVAVAAEALRKSVRGRAK